MTTGKLNIRKVLEQRLDFWTKKFRENPNDLSRGHIDELHLLLEEWGKFLEEVQNDN